MEHRALEEEDAVSAGSNSEGNGGSMGASEAMRRIIEVEDVHSQGFLGSIRDLFPSRSRSKASLRDEAGRMAVTTPPQERIHDDRLAPLPLMRSIVGCPYQPGAKSSPQMGVVSSSKDRSVQLISLELIDDQHQPDAESSMQASATPSPEDFSAHDLSSGTLFSLPEQSMRGTVTEGREGHTAIRAQSPLLAPGYKNNPTTGPQATLVAPRAPQASYSVESRARERAALMRKIDEAKLETEFHDGYVVHTMYNWELSDRVGERSTWKEERKIGSGGYGSVWLQKEQGGQLRAVKVLSRGLQMAGLSQELLALVKLKDYDHLFVTFLGWYENTEKIFLAMEYIEYGDLGCMPKETAKVCANEVTRQILQGLEALHEKDIFHRDLKPQNILIASLDPIWVKITDFGISKRAKKTKLRTMMCGTDGYIAPELNRLLPRKLETRELLGSALDIWSLGSLVHELLTSQTPFAELNGESGSEYDSETGVAELPSRGSTDMVLLREYCYGTIEFPAENLRASQVSEEGIAFVKSLLDPDPKKRQTATSALQSPWLGGYTSDWFENLRNEFSLLGANLDCKDIFVRQAHSADILPFLPTSKEKILSLLLEATAKGYNLAVSKLLESPSREPIGPLTRGKLFQLADKARELDTIKMLLHNGVDVDARIDGKTVLQWAVKAGHPDTVILLLEDDNALTSIDYKNVFLLTVKSGRIDIVKVLLGSKFGISVCDDSCHAALRVAAEGGHIDIVKLLLDNNTEVNATVALQAAAGGGHIDIVKFLLDNNAEVNATVVLQAAAEGGHIDIVKLLLDNNAEVNATAVLQAAGGGHIDIVKLLLDNNADVDATAAFQAAAGGGHIDIVKLLLDHQADVNGAATECDEGRTALQAAAEGGHIDIVKLLLDNNADVNAGASFDGYTALQAAAEGGHIDIVKLLLDNNADVNAGASFNGYTALQAAAEGGHTDIVKLLLDNNAIVNTEVPYLDGHTALQAAAEGGHIDIVKLLLDNNADVNARAASFSGHTALQAAAKSGHTDIVKLLLDNNADVNAFAASFEGHTALQAAAEGGHIDIVKLLLDNNADVNDTVALQAAAGGGHIDIVKLLLDNNADVNAEVSFGGHTALQAAAEGGHIDIVKLLLDHQADVNGPAAECDDGRTALRAAAGGGHIDIVKLLLDNNADVNAGAYLSDHTALQAAAEGGHIDIVKLLLDNKADVSDTVALQAAAAGGHIDIVKLLLDNNAIVNGEVYFSGHTALQAAASGGHIDTVKLLLDNKADVNAEASFSGHTALQAATEGGHIDIVKLLLDYQADVNGAAAECDDGRTALQAAAEGGRIDIFTMLLGSGADITTFRPEEFTTNTEHIKAFQDAISLVSLRRQ